MKTPVAWRYLSARPLATAVKLAALTFAIVLIFMQIALYELCLVSAVQQYDMLEFDLLLASSGYQDLAQPSDFPSPHLAVTLSDPDVSSASPFYVGMVQWRNPDSGLLYPVLTMGVPPTVELFRQPELRRDHHLLTQTNGVLFDMKTLPVYGPRYTGLQTTAGGEAVTVVGTYSNGAGFSGGGAMVVSDATFTNVSTSDRPGYVNLGLLSLKPGADPAAVARRLNASLPPTVRVRTRAQLAADEQNFFVNRKPVGIMFSSGVVLGFLIGAVIFYQVLATDVMKQLRQFATMKAIGYSDGAVSKVVLQQAALFAVFSFVPGFLIGLGLYAALGKAATINLEMTPAKAGFVFAMTLAMCAVSGLIGVRKTRTADPAELF